jgi:hypothetical protein
MRALLLSIAVFCALAPLLFCSSCQSIGAFAGATTAAVSGVVTSNPAVGIGVGIAVQAATDAAIKRTMRSLHQDQQDMIAAIAGQAPIGAIRFWKVQHALPIENGYGRVIVLRDVKTPLTVCREFAFSVIEDEMFAKAVHEQWFMAGACKQGRRWQWALAEPSTARWGNLH